MEKFWCGDEAGFELYLTAQAQANNMVAKGGDSFPEPEPMYTRVGTVGVVTIKGPLVAGDAGFMRLFGITGYDNIRQAMLDGLNDKQAKSIMLSIDSGGGSVNGTSDTAKFIKSIAAAKPVTAYADNAASAAYWLASAADHITSAETAITGSIGVLRVHTEYSKMDEKDGVTRTILRAGKYKALINPIEPLSDVAKAEADVMLQELYKSFVTRVAENRGTTYAIADTSMGQGREFMGSKALEVGLIDKIGTYEDALAHAASINSANKGNSATTGVARASLVDNNTGNPKGTEVKPTLNAEQLLAATIGSEQSAEEIATAEAAALLAAQNANQTIDTVKAELVTAKETLTVKETELATVNAKLVEAQASIDAGTQAAIDAGDTIKALSAIVSAYTSNMVIALGGKPGEIQDLDAKALLVKHDEIATTFKTKFKAGGHAATPGMEEKPPVKKVVSPMFAAMVKNVTAK